MKPVLPSSSILVSILPGLGFAARPDETPGGQTNSQADVMPDGEEDVPFPAALRPDFARCVAVDGVTGRVFAALQSPAGNCVLRFLSGEALQGGAAPEAVFNLPVLTAPTPVPNLPSPAKAPALACDDQGRLWVADTLNHRVLRFDSAGDLPSGAEPSGVLGQTGFSGSAPGVSASRLNAPADIALDGHGRLYVADTGNARVLWFNDAARRGNGASANGVIGQPDFEARGPGGVWLKRPSRLAATGGGRGMPVVLWVADATGRQMLRFDNATALPLTGARPSALFADGKLSVG